ncbi:MAG: single-stranded DNA-binding protein [Chloroflexi bacterium]|uniref:single-stranded DNA-binding protein n=1 Tax=Candidatus Flexifilum breve TaxID=3140694 RepID=UPI00313729FE|nr:single-stranded DNA-binding protein [Chloroflexota bacterium]
MFRLPVSSAAIRRCGGLGTERRIVLGGGRPQNRAGEKQTLWVRVNCWNKLSDVAAQYVRKGSLVQVTAEWLRPGAWVDQGGTPQPSLDIDANRLVLLDRVQNGDAEHSEIGEQIPF